MPKFAITGGIRAARNLSASTNENIMDLFNNPVGYLTSLGKMLRILLFCSGCCLKTEVFKQLYSKARLIFAYIQDNVLQDKTTISG
jgi:hypothetical protein